MTQHDETDPRCYQEWLQAKRNMETPPLASKVLQAIREDEQRRAWWGITLWGWQQYRARMLKGMACLGALSVGSTPFVYLAYVARLIAY